MYVDNKTLNPKYKFDIDFDKDSIKVFDPKIDPELLYDLQEWTEQVHLTFPDNDTAFHYFGKLWTKDLQDTLRHLIAPYLWENAEIIPHHIWFHTYGPKDKMDAHHHIGCDKSGILYLNEVGSTTFIAHVPKHRPVVDIKSKPGRIVTFPSNMLHYVTPHMEEDKVRYVIAFNQVS